MLSFFNKIVITPSQTLFSNKRNLLDVLLILLVLYSLGMLINAVSSQNEMPVPILYKGYNGEDDKVKNKEIMIKEIKRLKLFSKVIKDNIQKNNVTNDIAKAPLYMGRLKLVGILEHADESKSIAIIDSGVAQETYFTHDRVEGTDSIIIVKILKDKVIISDDEVYYSLVILE
ncbi:type II secretion system protein N [Yersinia sp. 2540 StPb PI]|uniref:type II secretion system protein N n=1 Tax=Yersinia sp. 2540 StPb PI TaxID=3117406 RepID=UPI003FA44CC1